MFRFIPLFLALSVPTFAEELKTVPRVDLDNYLGTWYEQARLPNDFQDDIVNDGSGFGACREVSANYSKLPEGKIRVDNRCERVNEQGEVKQVQAIGKARVVEGSNGAKLKVNFTGRPDLEERGIGDGDYWVIELSPKNHLGVYTYSLVGTPDRTYAWILTRTKEVSPMVLDSLVKKLEEEGFDTTKLVFRR